MAGREWSDMMPHRITVRSLGEADEWGNKDYDDSTSREYMCLIDENANIIVTTYGEDIKYGTAAYIDAIPVGEVTPRAIWPEDEVIFDPVPRGQPKQRPVDKLENHYWKDGTLHNIVLMFR